MKIINAVIGLIILSVSETYVIKDDNNNREVDYFNQPSQKQFSYENKFYLRDIPKTVEPDKGSYHENTGIPTLNIIPRQQEQEEISNSGLSSTSSQLLYNEESSNSNTYNKDYIQQTFNFPYITTTAETPYIAPQLKLKQISQMKYFNSFYPDYYTRNIYLPTSSNGYKGLNNLLPYSIENINQQTEQNYKYNNGGYQVNENEESKEKYINSKPSLSENKNFNYKYPENSGSEQYKIVSGIPKEHMEIIKQIISRHPLLPSSTSKQSFREALLSICKNLKKYKTIMAPNDENKEYVHLIKIYSNPEIEESKEYDNQSGSDVKEIIKSPDNNVGKTIIFKFIH